MPNVPVQIPTKMMSSPATLAFYTLVKPNTIDNMSMAIFPQPWRARIVDQLYRLRGRQRRPPAQRGLADPRASLVLD
jgi:hypothetical protein